MSDFAQRLVAWQAIAGRHGLPWQGGGNPYAVWLSEVMLQQTQVVTVIPYFLRFITRFPDIASLAQAPVDAVLGFWSGLGYYARARHLHRAAGIILHEHGGVFPQDRAAIEALPGIGRSTAAAILAFTWGQRAAILDGNVKRVLSRCFGIEGYPGEKAVENRLWALAESLLPFSDIEAYTQGLMDLGATLCTRARPDCAHCIMADICVARRQGRVAELPTPKPRKARPTRYETALILVQDGGVWLEKRPPTGIWGGLLAPPLLPSDISDTPSWALSALGLIISPPAALPALIHDFTHFRLVLQPMLAQAEVAANAVREASLLWLALNDGKGDFTTAPLPAPIRKLLLTHTGRTFSEPLTGTRYAADRKGKSRRQKPE